VHREFTSKFNVLGARQSRINFERTSAVNPEETGAAFGRVVTRASMPERLPEWIGSLIRRPCYCARR
jgi:hypothetical protein